jgi:hypothetical protein
MSRPPDAAPPADRLEARLGRELAAALSAARPDLAPDVAERLRFARTQAVARARAGRPSPEPAVLPAFATAGGPSGPRSRTGAAPWQFGLGLLPLLLLALGLVAVGRSTSTEQARVAAEIDARLLSDTLPPEAYVDPGFAEFLRRRGGS